MLDTQGLTTFQPTTVLEFNVFFAQTGCQGAKYLTHSWRERMIRIFSKCIPLISRCEPPAISPPHHVHDVKTYWDYSRVMLAKYERTMLRNPMTMWYSSFPSPSRMFGIHHSLTAYLNALAHMRIMLQLYWADWERRKHELKPSVTMHNHRFPIYSRLSRVDGLFSDTFQRWHRFPRQYCFWEIVYGEIRTLFSWSVRHK